jgi:Fe-Mn family superoxide dismutase
MAFELPDLPYAKDALASKGVSAETLEFHHDKHHNAYVTKLNSMVEGTDDASKSLEDIISGAETHSGLFNQAAQHWNHSFFWHCMSPTGGGSPSGDLGERIASAFGSYDSFKEEFTQAAMTQFGSGWAWLVDDGSGLKVMKTLNADLPMKHSAKALLTLDVWEHAYYIDFRNKRPDHIDNFLANVVNWDFVADNLSS